MRVLVILVVSLVASSVGAEAQEQRSLSACGRVNGFTQATPTTDGSITIGTRAYVLRADALYSRSGGNIQALVVGREICLNGSLDASGAFVQYSGHDVPQPYCGRVLEVRAPTSRTAGSLAIQGTGVATFPIPIGTDLSNDAPSPDGSTYKCYSLAIDGGGDAYVTGRFIRTVDRVVARLQVCGRVLDYARATSAAAGAVRIGSRTLPIERGFVYTGDPAGDRTDRTMVGADVCLTGGLSVGGELIDFITQPFRDRTCSTAASYRPPSATADGLLVLSVPGNPDYMRLIVPIGTDLGAAATGDICLSYAVNSAGDAYVTGRFRPSPGVAAAPAIPQLPSTSTR